MGHRPALAIIACLALLPAHLPAQAPGMAGKDLLRAEFWADIEPVPAAGEPWPVSAEDARARILAEAAWVFGGIVWGFDFSYTPFDKTRALKERFDLVPIGSLDPSQLVLAPGARASLPDALYSYVEYAPGTELESLMEGYAKRPWKGAQGIGRADMILGVKGRRAAYVDGLRAAVRSLLQGMEPNKPREVRGRVVFDRPPSMAIIGGFYTAQVRARAMVIEVLPYKVY